MERKKMFAIRAMAFQTDQERKRIPGTDRKEGRNRNRTEQNRSQRLTANKIFHS